MDYQEFWNKFEAEGAEAAIAYATTFAADNEGWDEVMNEHVPGLITIAKVRDINMIDFLAQLDKLESDALAEADNADGTDNDAGGISPDVDSQDRGDEDADVAATSQSDDGEDRGSDEGSSSS